MSIRNSVLWSARTLVVLAPFSLAQAGVHIVDASGSGDFTTIQAAVDASSDGDVILVHDGTYAAFTIDNKGLAVYADLNANVAINGAVQVVNVVAAKTVVLSGLRVTGTSTNPAPSVALSCTNNLGVLRFQKCTLQGGQGLSNLNDSTESYPPAAHGVLLANDPNVSFVGCAMQGGNAFNNEYCFDCTGGAGGDGVNAQASSVAVYDSLCAGGSGGSVGQHGGAGGAGYRALSWGGFASRSTFKGGQGGYAADYIVAVGGPGGDGVHVNQGAGFIFLSESLIPGAGGASFLGPSYHGAPGSGVGGPGAAYMLPGFARVFSATTITGNGGTTSLTVYGQEGDKVFLPQSLRTSIQYSPALSGVWLIPHPAYLPVDPIAVIPASGSVTLDVSLLHLPSGVDAGVAFAQGFVISADGQKFLGSPVDVLML
jgi:hypothetical protein